MTFGWRNLQVFGKERGPATEGKGGDGKKKKKKQKKQKQKKKKKKGVLPEVLISWQRERELCEGMSGGTMEGPKPGRRDSAKL